MRTTRVIASEVLSNLPAHIKGEIVRWSPEIDQAVYDCMRQYAYELLDHILTRQDLIYSMKYNGYNEPDTREEALFDYEKVNELKNSLK